MQPKRFMFYVSLLVSLLMPLFMSACAGNANQASFGETVDDSVITAKVKAALIEDKMVSAADIHVETFKGTVQLSGFASSAGEISRAVDLARQVKGVQTVKNDVRLKSSQP